MEGRDIEPRKVIWAVAEITWEDDSGTSFRVPAVLEDTSRSGACVRLKRPLAVGSRITIKWYREQFPAIARNCRRMGEISCWAYGERQKSSPAPSRPATGQLSTPKQSGRWKVPPQLCTRSRRLHKQRRRIQSTKSRLRPLCQNLHRRPRVDNHVSRARMPLWRLRRACAQKLTLRARPLVPKGQLCNPRRCFHIFGAVSRTKTRLQNQPPRRLQ